jgi:hypothetical protein
MKTTRRKYTARRLGDREDGILFSLGLMPKDITMATDLSKRLDSKNLFDETLFKSWVNTEAKLSGVTNHTEIFRMLNG